MTETETVIGIVAEIDWSMSCRCGCSWSSGNDDVPGDMEAGAVRVERGEEENVNGSPSQSNCPSSFHYPLTIHASCDGAHDDERAGALLQTFGEVRVQTFGVLPQSLLQSLMGLQQTGRFLASCSVANVLEASSGCARSFAY